MTYDLIVIGGGPAGYLASERAGQAGFRVLCFEGRSLGGVCLNEGCIPTKTLLYSAKLYDGVRDGSKYGVTASELQIDHGRVVARKNKVVKTLVAGVSAALRASGVTVIQENAAITGRNRDGYTVSANGETYVGKRLLIATGSSPAFAPIPGLKEGYERGFVLTNREMLDLRERPDRLVVIGGGVIGLEFASYFTSIGTKVTAVEALDHIAGEQDSDLTRILQKNLEKKGMEIRLSTKVTEVTSNGVRCEQDGAVTFLEADKVLLSIGRKANSSAIGLESIHVLTEQGAIKTDEQMKTNQPEVYAAGDVNGRSMLAHTAYREAEVAVNTMLGKKDSMRYDVVPSVLYTNPELASVGETEYSARAKGLDIGTVKLPMRFSGRYLAENEGGDGMMKLIVNTKTETIAGLQVLGNHASEFIVSAGMLIECSVTINEIKKMVFPHPTVGEIIREAVFQYRPYED